MTPTIKQLEETKLIGRYVSMTIADNNTMELWKSMGPRIKEIECRLGQDKWSIQLYPDRYLEEFDPHKEFVKWAAVPVSSHDVIPSGLQSLVIETGLYAVFKYKGHSKDNTIYQYIFSEWIPKSQYVVDDRPHFEVLGAAYKNNDPNSEEEIWIPIKPSEKT